MKSMFKNSWLLILTILSLVMSIFGGTPTPVYAAGTVTVTKTADTDDGVCDSDCSLREAIASASAGDTIIFDAALSGGTIYLTSTLGISMDLTIDGSALASRITLSGDSDNNGTGDVRVFSTTSPDFFGRTLTLESLIVAKGYESEGGGLLVGEDMTVNVINSVFSGNSASANGGALSNYGTVTITDSTFSSNSSAGGAGGGGAILNSQVLTINGSTFSGNTAGGSGSGGAVFNTSPTATITNSTFYGNSADFSGGAIITTNALTITNSTISGNSAYPGTGGGISIQGNITNLSNTIIANSTSGGDCLNFGTIGTNTNNLIEDGSCSPTLSGDPHLGPLQDNGGPTQTMAFGAGSPAVNAGDNANCPATDQRGQSRPQGSRCDIGAYEVQIFSESFTSTGALDGQLMESSETSNRAGLKNSTSSIFKLGDDIVNRQYRGILSFDTTILPDTASVTNITLNLKRAGVVGGGNPVNLFKGFMVDIKNGDFGTAALALGDFKTVGDKTLGPFKPAFVGGGYSLDLSAANLQINALGDTQLRLRFKLDDNNNQVANYLKLYSGNADPANQPQLVIEYYLP